jgi:hypothetical protein
MRLPDPGRMFGLPGSLARPLARRIHAVNAVVDAVAARFGTVHFDAAGHPSTYDRRMWSVDRLHPSERGHRLLAGCYFDLLDRPGHRPDPEPNSPAPTRRAQLGWLATKGTQWLADRSTDLVPYLARMAMAEWWYGVRGRTCRLDASVAQDTRAALAALSRPARVLAWPDQMDETPISYAPSR